MLAWIGTSFGLAGAPAMPTATWSLLAGGIVLGVGRTVGLVGRLPVATSTIDLAVGILVGPTVLYAFRFNPPGQSRRPAAITAVAVLLSRVTAGMSARPPGVLVASLGTRMPRRLRGLTGWFGTRGIGSLYYLMHAVEHGLPEALALLEITLIVVTLSILLHGFSAKPMMTRFRRRNGGPQAEAV